MSDCQEDNDRCIETQFPVSDSESESFPATNTDREIWRKGDGDGNGMSYYEPSIHVTDQGDIGINVGGTVYVLPVEDWHQLAATGLHPDGTLKWRHQRDA